MPFEPAQLKKRAALFVSSLTLGLGLVASAAQAREAVDISSPFEVSESPAGNYLAARVAEFEHDTLAASTFFRESLRSDPQNVDLVQRAFVAALANGDMVESFVLAQKVLARDPHNSSARLALGVRDLKLKSYAAARKELSAGVANKQRDLTAVLLTAWSQIGSGDVKKALALVDSLNEPSFAVFRDFHAGLMLEVAGRPGRGRQTACRRLCQRQGHSAPCRRLRPQPLATGQGRRGQGRLRGFRQDSAAPSDGAGGAGRSRRRQEA